MGLFEKFLIAKVCMLIGAFGCFIMAFSIALIGSPASSQVFYCGLVVALLGVGLCIIAGLVDWKKERKK